MACGSRRQGLGHWGLRFCCTVCLHGICMDAKEQMAKGSPEPGTLILWVYGLGA